MQIFEDDPNEIIFLLNPLPLDNECWTNLVCSLTYMDDKYLPMLNEGNPTMLDQHEYECK